MHSTTEIFDMPSALLQFHSCTTLKMQVMWKGWCTGQLLLIGIFVQLQHPWDAKAESS